MLLLLLRGAASDHTATCIYVLFTATPSAMHLAFAPASLDNCMRCDINVYCLRPCHFLRDAASVSYTRTRPHAYAFPPAALPPHGHATLRARERRPSSVITTFNIYLTPVYRTVTRNTVPGRAVRCLPLLPALRMFRYTSPPPIAFTRSQVCLPCIRRVRAFHLLIFIHYITRTFHTPFAALHTPALFCMLCNVRRSHTNTHSLATYT